MPLNGHIVVRVGGQVRERRSGPEIGENERHIPLLVYVRIVCIGGGAVIASYVLAGAR